MSTEFKIPELGENIESGDVVKVLVKPGDDVAVDQTVLELETDKAVVEVPSSVQGKVTDVLVKEGEKASVGQVVLKLSSNSAPAPKKEKVEKTPEPVAEEPKKKESKPKKVKEEPVKVAEPAVEEVVETPKRQNSPEQIIAASPSVRRLAREIGVDLDHVPVGEGERLTLEDVKKFARKKTAVKVPAPGGTVTNQNLPDFSKWGEIEKKAMSSVRRKTAIHLTEAWTAPHVTQCEKVDITNLEKIRKEYSERVKKAGGKLTMTVIIMKVIASALKVFPQFNASVDMTTGEIIYKKYFNVGIAVDTERGLLVPVIRDVNDKNIIQLSKDITEAAEKARTRKLTLDEMQGGTFTITNLGGIGGTHFTPVVNAPEVAILGVSRSNLEPVFVDGEFKPRLMLPLSLSYDHRLIDGADAMRFLRWVAEAMQQPFLLGLEG